LIKSKTPLFLSTAGLWRCSPLAYLTTEDVFLLYDVFKTPLNPIYTKTKFTKKEHIRNSGWLSTDGAKDGSIVWLKYYYPQLFSRLSKEFPQVRGYV